ncbi:hypothetical protein ACFLRN_03355 [Thermoproteota archaeon]
MELFRALLDSGVLIPGVALTLVFFVAYLLVSAKHSIPLSVDEIETLWKAHKQSTYCKADNWIGITKKQEMIGYKCECGYKQIQKKPLLNFN